MLKFFQLVWQLGQLIGQQQTILEDVLDKGVGMNLLRLLFRQMMPFSDNHRASHPGSHLLVVA